MLCCWHVVCLHIEKGKLGTLNLQACCLGHDLLRLGLAVEILDRSAHVCTYGTVHDCAKLGTTATLFAGGVAV